MDSGKGKCPFDPKLNSVSALISKSMLIFASRKPAACIFNHFLECGRIVKGKKVLPVLTLRDVLKMMNTGHCTPINNGTDSLASPDVSGTTKTDLWVAVQCQRASR